MHVCLKTCLLKDLAITITIFNYFFTFENEKAELEKFAFWMADSNISRPGICSSGPENAT